MKLRGILEVTSLLALEATIGVSAARAADGSAQKDFIHVGSFELPRHSDLLSEETRAGIERMAALRARAYALCDPAKKTTGAEIRACEAVAYPPIIAEARRLYDVRIESKRVGGVDTEIVTPRSGAAATHRRRVLINVHGGGFMYGARFIGQIESMPIAALGGYKVVAVDYRMAPEHSFPAASVDVASVYRALLKEYDASSIGLFGCSAGGRIVGQTLVWMAEQKLPRPGAVAILCSPPTQFGGDSNVIAMALQGRPPLVRNFTEGYFKGVSPWDQIAFPGGFDEQLAKFPPTLLMTSGRDYSLSPMVRMHSRLVHLGVPTALHIFEGLPHAEFVMNFYLPEARHAARVVSAFFDEHLTVAGTSAPREP